MPWLFVAIHWPKPVSMLVAPLSSEPSGRGQMLTSAAPSREAHSSRKVTIEPPESYEMPGFQNQSPTPISPIHDCLVMMPEGMELSEVVMTLSPGWNLTTANVSSLPCRCKVRLE